MDKSHGRMRLFLIIASLSVLPGNLLLGCSEGDPPKDLMPTPAVSMPVDDTVIDSPVLVTGTGVPGATVNVSVTLQQTEIGLTSVVADDNGNYSAIVSFPTQPKGTVLLICVTQETHEAISPVAVVTVPQGDAPDAPTIATPAKDDQIRSPLTVIGLGEVGLSVTVDVLEQATIVGSAEGHVDENGEFRVDVPYATASNTLLTVRAYQSGELRMSPPAAVPVVQSSFAE